MILDVYGELFFGSSFTHDADWYPGPWPSGDTRLEAISVFTKPKTNTSATGIIWYAALTDPAVTSANKLEVCPPKITPFSSNGEGAGGWDEISPGDVGISFTA